MGRKQDAGEGGEGKDAGGKERIGWGWGMRVRGRMD